MENELNQKTNIKGNKKFQFLFWSVFGVICMSILAIATTTVNENGVSTNGEFQTSGINLTSTYQAPELVFLPNGFLDTANTSNRSAISFYAGSTKQSDRPLSIETHIGNITQGSGHPNHVTFYSRLVNNSINSAPRAFEWFWGSPATYDYNNSADGRLYMNYLTNIRFKTSWVGYFGNETERKPGLEFDGNIGDIVFDADNDSTGSSILNIYNANSLVGETVGIGLQNRATLRYNGGNNTLDIMGGSGKSVSIYTNNAEKVKFDLAGNMTLTALAGTYTNGEAYLCVNNTGFVFAKESACS